MRSNLFPVLRMFGVWTSMVLGNELFVFHEPLPPGRKPRSWSGWIQERIHYQLFHNSKVYIINVIVVEITSKYYVIQFSPILSYVSICVLWHVYRVYIVIDGSWYHGISENMGKPWSQYWAIFHASLSPKKPAGL